MRSTLNDHRLIQIADSLHKLTLCREGVRCCFHFHPNVRLTGTIGLASWIYICICIADEKMQMHMRIQDDWACPYYSPILPSVYGNGAPSGLIAKTKSNQSQGREATLLKVLHSCLMSRYRWEGWCLRLKTSTFKPCHIICQLSSALDNVDGVKAGFLEPSFRLS